MKKRTKLIIFCLVFIIIAGSRSVYKNCFVNIDSNNYLSTSDESERSFSCHENENKSKMLKVLILKSLVVSGH